MRKNILRSISYFFIIFVCWQSFIYAQPYAEWTQNYGGIFDDEGWDMQPTSDGGFIITGWTSSFGNGNRDVYLIKTDEYGDTIWTRTYGGSNNDAGRSVKQTLDGGYIICGYTESFGAGGMDFYLIKTNTMGDTIWTKTFGGGAYDEGFSVIQAADTGFALVGTTESFAYAYHDLYLIKTDSLGNQQWTKQWDRGDWDRGADIQHTNDGGYIIVGHSWWNGPVPGGNVFVYLIKTDELGNTDWAEVYGIGEDQRGYSVQQTFDNGYVVAAHLLGTPGGDYDAYILKTDENGVEQWHEVFGGPGNESANCVIETIDYNIMICGYTESFGSGGRDVFLVETDSLGDSLWAETYGFAEDDEGFGIIQSDDEAFYVAGKTVSPGTLESDVMLFKIPGPLYLISTSPDQNELDIPEIGNIALTFNGNMNPSDFNDSTLILRGNYRAWYDGFAVFNSLYKTIVFDTYENFYPGETITVTMTDSLVSAQGVPLDSSFQWQFTVRASEAKAEFSIDSSYALGLYPAIQAAADFDNDDDIDLTVISRNSNRCSVLLNDGNGTFMSPDDYDVGSSAHGICTGDVDNDGDMDIAIVNRIAAGTIRLLINNGDGSFTQKPLFSAQANEPTSLILTDINKDGLLDLATGNAGSDNISVFFNSGDTSFVFHQNYLAGDVSSIFAGDVDNDGDSDLMGGLWANNAVFVFLNNGDSTFSSVSTYPVGVGAGYVEAADFNEDGYLDICTTDHYDQNVSVLLNLGDGTFDTHVTYQIGTAPSMAYPADLDGDGDMDIAAHNREDDNISILLNNGDGTFAGQQVYATGDAPIHIIAADFDNDGDLDLSTTNGNAGTVSILFNENIASAMENIGNIIPDHFSLEQNYPNPFNPVTTIRYALKQAEDVKLTLYDMLGQKVRVLLDEHQKAGWYDIRLNAKDLSNGVYIYRIKAGKFIKAHKMVIIK